jgi:hypothetical protein
MIVTAEDRGEIRQHLIELLAVRARRERGVLGSLELRCRDELHRSCDLLDIPDGADPAPDVTLASHVEPQQVGDLPLLVDRRSTISARRSADRCGPVLVLTDGQRFERFGGFRWASRPVR